MVNVTKTLLPSEYRTEYEDIGRQCRDLTVELLELCHNTEELEVLLSEGAGTAADTGVIKLDIPL